MLLSDLELKPVGILEVKLVQAKGLTNKDIIGKSDPYAELYIRPLRDRIKKSKTIVSYTTYILLLSRGKTGCSILCHFFFTILTNKSCGVPQNNDLNPIWNEHYEFIVEDPLTQHLTVKIYDDEGVQSSELIGCAQVQLSELEPGKIKDVWLNLVKDLDIRRDNKNRGQVRILVSHLVSTLCAYELL